MAAATLVLLVLPGPRLAHGGKLEETRAAARSDSSASSSSGSSGSSSSSSEKPATRRGKGLPPILICATVVGAPFCLPYLLLEGPHDRPGLYPHRGAFLSHPYRGGARGHLIRELGEKKPGLRRAGPPPATQRFALRLAGEYAADIDGVHRPSFALQLDTVARFGFEGSWTHLMERTPGGLDHLNLADGNLIFRFAQHELLEFRAGLGLKLLFDRQEIFPGFNFTYGIDVFPVRPLVFSLVLDLGNLGTTFALHFRSTVGAALGPVELYAGYDTLLVQPVLYHGPVVGVRLWF